MTANAGRYRSSDLDEQLREYAPLVKRIAGQIVSRLPPSVSLDDLVQEGMTGLLDALQRYRPQPNLSFEHYASFRIRGSIYDACRRNDVLPRHQRDRARELAEVSRRLTQTLGREPSEQELASEAGLSAEQFRATLDVVINIGPLDDLPESLFASSDQDDPAEQVDLLQMTEKVVAALKQLPEKQQLVVALHYEQHLSYRQIAAVIDLTPGRISQLHTQAMLRLRSLLTKN